MYKYGYFNDQGTILISSVDRAKLSKEFTAFATSRREFIAQRNQKKTDNKIESIRKEFNHVPKINMSSEKSKDGA